MRKYFLPLLFLPSLSWGAFQSDYITATSSLTTKGHVALNASSVTLQGVNGSTVAIQAGSGNTGAAASNQGGLLQLGPAGRGTSGGQQTILLGSHGVGDNSGADDSSGDILIQTRDGVFGGAGDITIQGGNTTIASYTAGKILLQAGTYSGFNFPAQTPDVSIIGGGIIDGSIGGNVSGGVILEVGSSNFGSSGLGAINISTNNFATTRFGGTVYGFKDSSFTTRMNVPIITATTSVSSAFLNLSTASTSHSSYQQISFSTLPINGGAGPQVVNHYDWNKVNLNSNYGSYIMTVATTPYYVTSGAGPYIPAKGSAVVMTPTTWFLNFHSTAAPSGETSVSATADTFELYSQNPLRFYDSDSDQYTALKSSAALSSSFDLVLPSTAGATGDVIINNGSGVMRWNKNGTGINLASGVSGILPIANGGTSNSSFGSDSYMIFYNNVGDVLESADLSGSVGSVTWDMTNGNLEVNNDPLNPSFGGPNVIIGDVPGSIGDANFSGFMVGNDEGDADVSFRIDGYANVMYIIARTDSVTTGSEIRMRTAPNNGVVEADRFILDSSGRQTWGATASTSAWVNINQTPTTSIAPLYMKPGPLLTAPIPGMIENDGWDYYVTNSSTKQYQLLRTTQTLAAGQILVSTGPKSVTTLPIGGTNQVVGISTNAGNQVGWVNLSRSLDFGWPMVGNTREERWYPAGAVGQSNGLGTSAFAINTLFAVPFVLSSTRTVDQIGFYVTTAGGASSVARCGIYDAVASTDPYPNNLIFDGGEQVTTSTASKKTTINWSTGTPNALYFAVYSAGTSAPTIRSAQASSGISFYGWNADLSSAAGVYVSSATTYSALPSKFPHGGQVGAGQAPVIFLHYSQ